MISLEHVNNNPHSFKKTIDRNIEHFIHLALDDNYLSEQEEAHVREFAKIARFDLNDSTAESRSLLNRSIVIRNLIEGKVEPYFTKAPVLLSKGEMVIWYEDDCAIMMPKTVKEHRGGSRGVSIKIAKGVYYHMGQSRARTISKEVLSYKGKGYFVVTNKNVFVGAINKKIPLSKIVYLEESSKGLIIWFDNHAKPLYVVCSDQAFYINAIMNAYNWA